MKKSLKNILIILIFIISIVLADYIFILFSKTNVHNYQNNNNTKLTVLKNENKLLKEELNKTLSLNKLDNYNNYDYLKSTLLLRDIYNFHETITIKYGKDQNIKKGMAVVSEYGLIGIIDKVNKKSSIVKLLTAQDSRVSIKIGENYGALDNYDLDKQELIASNFNNYELIMKDEEVYTSGLGLMPEGIYVGKVKSTKSTNANIEQKVYIKSENDFNNLKYVAIIKGMKDI